MFYIFVEIFSWKQLMRLEPETMSRLEEQINDLVQRQGGENTPHHPKLFAFSSYYDESMSRIIDTLFLLQELLLQYKDDLHGFSLIMSSQEENLPFQMRKLENLTYRIMQEGSIWLDKNCAEVCERFLCWEEYPGILKVENKRKRSPLLPERRAMLLTRNDLMEHLDESLERVQFKESSQIELLRYQNQKELELAVGMWVEKWEKDNPVLHLYGLFGEQTFSPFIESLSGDVLDWGKERHHDPYWHLLEQFKEKDFSKIRRDRLLKDFEAAYRMYLDRYREFCKAQKKAPIILIKDIPCFSGRGLDLLKWTLDKWSAAGPGLILLLTDERETPWDRLSKSRTFRLPERSLEEKKVLIQKSFPLYADSMLLKESIIDELSAPELFLMGLQFPLDRKWESVSKALELCFKDMDESLKRILYLISLREDWAEKDILTLAFQQNHLDPSRLSDYLERLEHMGLVEMDFRKYYRLSWSEAGTILDKEISGDEHFCNLLTTFNDIVYKKWLDTRQVDPYRFLRLMEQSGSGHQLLGAMDYLLNWLLDNQMFDEVHDFLDKPVTPVTDMAPDYEESLQNLQNAARTRKALLQSESGEMEKMVLSGDLSLVAAKGEFVDSFSLQVARYYLSNGFPEQALNYSKEALFGFQKAGDHNGEVYANCELALALMAQRKLGSAMDYFEIARRIGFQLSHQHGLLLASSLECVAVYLFGNLSLALRNAENLIGTSREEGRRDREFLLQFLKGRILFDLGEYARAGENFAALKDKSSRLDYPQCSLLSKRWQARSLAYAGEVHRAYGLLSEEEPCREELFFLAEGDYLEGRIESALMKLDKALKIEERRIYNRSEKESWQNGFQPIEGRLMDSESESEVLEDQIESFRFFLMGKKGHYTEAVQGLGRLVRRGEYPFRPYSHKFLYLLSQINPEDSNSTDRSEDHLVHLSKAIEKLQSRAGRFDDQKLKMGYLNQNYWNCRIMQEAHKKKFL